MPKSAKLKEKPLPVLSALGVDAAIDLLRTAPSRRWRTRLTRRWTSIRVQLRQAIRN